MKKLIAMILGASMLMVSMWSVMADEIEDGLIDDVLIDPIDFDFDSETEAYRLPVGDDVSEVEVSYALVDGLLGEDVEVTINDTVVTTDASLTVELSNPITIVTLVADDGDAQEIYEFELSIRESLMDSPGLLRQFQNGWRFMYERLTMNAYEKCEEMPQDEVKRQAGDMDQVRIQSKTNQGKGSSNSGGSRRD